MRDMKKTVSVLVCRKGGVFMDQQAGQDIEALIALLDGRIGAGDSRIKVDVVEGEGQVVSRQYHHGRCDVGSPWACGTPFDILE